MRTNKYRDLLDLLYCVLIPFIFIWTAILTFIIIKHCFELSVWKGILSLTVFLSLGLGWIVHENL